jgi:hypothetical protein
MVVDEVTLDPHEQNGIQNDVGQPVVSFNYVT